MAHFCNQASFQSERLRRHQVIWGKKSTLDQKNPLIFQHLVIQSTAFERSRKTLYVCCNIACFLIHCIFLKTKLIFRKEIVIRETNSGRAVSYLINIFQICKCFIVKSSTYYFQIYKSTNIILNKKIIFQFEIHFPNRQLYFGIGKILFQIDDYILNNFKLINLSKFIFQICRILI